jgi:hypothetical protein
MMPFKPIDFASIPAQGNPFFRDLVENLATGYKAGQLPQELERQRKKEELANQLQEYLVKEQPQKFNEESQERQLKNAFQSMLNQQQPAKFGSEQLSAAVLRAFQQAETGKINTMTPLEAKELALKNELYPELTKSQIANNLALSKQRASGVSGLNAAGKEEYFLQNATEKSNPKFTPDQVFDATNAIKSGKKTLEDGTPINITQAMIGSLDRIAKTRTTTEIITNVLRSKQADVETGVLNKYIGDAIEPFGDTIDGYSPRQIMSTISNNKEDQIKLGRLAAAQQLATDTAANQNIINSGRPTASITREILRDSETKIKATWPFMSNIARQESLRYLKEALDATLKAKLSVGIGAAGAFTPSEPQSEPPKRRKIKL